MRTQEITTNKLSDFGPRERGMLVELLTAWKKQGLPENFYDYEVEAMMNRNSGNVFLTNEEFQVAMMNGDRLEMWHSCPNCGHEGFSEDCQINEENECNECSTQSEAE